MLDSLAPGFLVAVPQLLDPNFKQSVVLLIEQSDQGSMGVVINSESPLLLSDLCKNHDIEYQGDPGKRVRVGGPINPEQGFVLYEPIEHDTDGRPILESLRVSASTLTLSRLASESGIRYHCYTGYAGWGPGQLEREIDEGSWIIVPADALAVLEGDPEEIWRQALVDNGIDPAAIVPAGGDPN